MLRWKSKIWLRLLLALVLWPTAAPAAEFSATIVDRMGDDERTGKIYLQGEKGRQELATEKGDAVIISRPDKKVMWFLFPGKKAFIEKPLDITNWLVGMEWSKYRTQWKSLGTETLHGYETRKYEVEVKGKGATAKNHVWVAKKLDTPIKIATPDGEFSLEFRDIKEGVVSADLFEIPPGYQKMGASSGEGKWYAPSR